MIYIRPGWSLKVFKSFLPKTAKKLWRWPSLEHYRTLRSSVLVGRSLAFSPDSRTLVAVGMMAMNAAFYGFTKALMTSAHMMAENAHRRKITSSDVALGLGTMGWKFYGQEK